MKKLLSLFTLITFSSTSSVAFLNNFNETNHILDANSQTNSIINYSNKISLLTFKFKTVVINDFDGLNEDNLFDEILLNIIENNPEYEDFVTDVSANKENYNITGTNFKIPEENESNNYNIRITANSNNPLYTGTARIKVVFLNKKVIKISEYQYLFNASITQLSLESIGHENNPKYWEKKMLLELDKQLINHNADMHGFDGKDGHESLFIHAYDNDLIEIDFGKAITSDFSEKYTNIEIKVKSAKDENYVLMPNVKLSLVANVIVKNSIDISSDSFSNYFNDLIKFDIKYDATENEWKQIIFQKVDERLENLEDKNNQKNLFSNNLSHLILSVGNNRLGVEGQYEIFEIAITTPSYVTDNLIPNRTLRIKAKIDKKYQNESVNIGYSYAYRTSSNWSTPVTNKDNKIYEIYNWKRLFKNIDNFKKKYKTIALDVTAHYSSDWSGFNGTQNNSNYLQISTADLKTSESGAPWNEILERYDEDGLAWAKVRVRYAVWIENDVLKLEINVYQGIKIISGSEYDLHLSVSLRKVNIIAY